MTNIERLNLINQYKILSLLSTNQGDKDYYEQCVFILRQGLVSEYVYLTKSIVSEIDPAVTNEVQEILYMFDALAQFRIDQSNLNNIIPREPYDTFIGFSGNDEIDHYIVNNYFRDKVYENGCYNNVNLNKASHSSHTLPKYRMMLEQFKSLSNKISNDTDYYSVIHA